jgi:hypothetical protein
VNNPTVGFRSVNEQISTDEMSIDKTYSYDIEMYQYFIIIITLVKL